MRVSGWKKGNGCQPPVSRDAAPPAAQARPHPLRPAPGLAPPLALPGSRGSRGSLPITLGPDPSCAAAARGATGKPRPLFVGALAQRCEERPRRSPQPQPNAPV